MNVKDVVQNIKDFPKETEEKLKGLPKTAPEIIRETTQMVKELPNVTSAKVKGLPKVSADLSKKTGEVIRKVQRDREARVYNDLDSLPDGFASNRITEGCLVLEGGAFRGIYTSGVCDALMKGDLNFRTTIGVSAGAMNGVNYVAGQIGRSARISLKYRNDSRYVGTQAMVQNHSIIGFDFIFSDMNKEIPIDAIRFNATNRDLYVVATNCITGQAEYFKKGECKDFFDSVAASASMPFVSSMVELNGQPYLDGGCACAIPYQWALDHNFKNIVVVRTRSDDFRNELDTNYGPMIKARYHNYPELSEKMLESDRRYNDQCNEIEMLAKQGRIFVISPSKPIDIGRLERDTERLSEVYYLGYQDTEEKLDALRKYLKRGEEK